MRSVMRSGMANRLVTLATLAVVGVLASGAASAQLGQTKEPIQVTAENLEATRDQGRAVYLGNVEAVQGSARMKADKLTVICAMGVAGAPKDECGEIRQMIAENNVYYITAEERITGQRAEYDYETDTITVTGNVVMVRGDDAVINGPKLVYEVQKGIARMSGEKGSRVTSIFTPSENKNSPTPSPAPAAPATRP